jgi:transaldolase
MDFIRIHYNYDYRESKIMKKGYFHRVTAQTPTRFWINNVTREEADISLEAGAVGCTQNPSYVYKMLTHESENEYASGVLNKVIGDLSDNDLAQETLQRELVREIALRFLPLWEKSNGKYGYVSIQGNPFKEDVENLIRNARFNRMAGANIMCKIPATEDGLKAIEVLMAEGSPINATEVMGVRQAMDVCDVYDKVASKMKNPPLVYISHITGIYDEYLGKYIKNNGIDISSDTMWQAGMIIARKIRRLMDERNSGVGFIGGGARGLHHYTEMVGADCCVTINWKGTAKELIRLDPPVVDRFHIQTPDSVLDELLEKVDDFKRGWMSYGLKASEYEEFGPVVLFRESFEKAWSSAVELIGKRRSASN